MDALDRAFGPWLNRDVTGQSRRRNYGFRDRQGTLRGAIRSGRTGYLQGALSANTDYAAVIEFAFKGRRSYLRPATEVTLNRLLARWQREADRL